MKSLSLMVLAVVLAVIAIVVVRNRRGRIRQAAPPEFANTQDMMNWLANEAVDISMKDGIDGLDYSIESIQRADAELEKIHVQYIQEKSDQGAKGLASVFGAYIGECIRRHNEGAHWEQDHPVMGERSYPLHWRGGESFPINWCYKRIMNGAGDNVWHKYQLLQQMRDHPPAETQPLLHRNP